ncbi:MAG: ester cyclase [Acidobacteria bacterium]|nr:ester cyclase [Acidobacteriota bacterium]
MSVESTRQTMEAYVRALLSFGDYSDYLAEDVTVTFMGTDREVRGREAARQLIDFVHQQAFRTDIQVKSAVYGDGSAMAEAEFVGTHIGEFEGVAASNRQVRVPYAAAYDLDGGKIKALRLYFPMELLLRQIGGAQ